MTKVDNKLPRVSIIIPVYNGEDYVSLAIESALNQTYSNLEIIVVNDGSTDRTNEICKSYGEKIVYLNKKNGGVSTALNLGIEKMTGEYFSWLSHDDLYYENKIEDEVNYLLENKLVGKDVILYSDYSIINEYGELSCDILLNSRYLNRDSVYSMLFGSIDGLSLLIPKKAFAEVGNFDVNLRCVQDYQLWYDMYKKGYEFIHVPAVTVCTRVHAKQETKTNPKMIAEGNNYWKKVLSDVSDKEKVKLFGSKFNYWYILHTFFDGGAYKMIVDLCKKEYSKIIEKNKDVKPKVSVIVNLNSTRANNKKSLMSLVDQTYENVEYIIFHKRRVKNSILKELNDYKLIKTDKNDAAIWNDGINNATGEYVTFLDGNSYYTKDRIEKLIELSKNSESIMTYSSYYKYKKKENELVDIGFNNWQVDPLSKETLDINLSTVMVKMNAIKEYKIVFDEQMSCGEETVFIMEILRKGYPLGLRDPLVMVDKDSDYNKEQRINNAINYLVETFDLKDSNDIYSEGEVDDLRKARLLDLERYRINIPDEQDDMIESKNDEIDEHNGMLGTIYKKAISVLKKLKNIIKR